MPDPAPTYWEQPERVEVNTDGSKSITKSFKGDYAALVSYAGSLTIGTTAESDLPLRSVNITRSVGNRTQQTHLATLRLEFGADDSYDETKNAVVKSTNWSMKHTQRVVSLMRKTGGSASMPARGTLEAWKREPDPDLYNNFQYRNQVGSVMTLDQDAYLIAQKMIKGIEGAMRFYPTIQRVRVYTTGKIAGVGEGLAKIATMPQDCPWTNAAKSWLKVGDDIVLDSKAGTQTRTESWIGAKSWDADLYGKNAWDLDG